MLVPDGSLVFESLLVPTSQLLEVQKMQPWSGNMHFIKSPVGAWCSLCSMRSLCDLAHGGNNIYDAVKFEKKTKTICMLLDCPLIILWDWLIKPRCFPVRLYLLSEGAGGGGRGGGGCGGRKGRTKSPSQINTILKAATAPLGGVTPPWTHRQSGLPLICASPP